MILSCSNTLRLVPRWILHSEVWEHWALAPQGSGGTCKKRPNKNPAIHPNPSPPLGHPSPKDHGHMVHDMALAMVNLSKKISETSRTWPFFRDHNESAKWISEAINPSHGPTPDALDFVPLKASFPPIGLPFSCLQTPLGLPVMGPTSNDFAIHLLSCLMVAFIQAWHSLMLFQYFVSSIGWGCMG